MRDSGYRRWHVDTELSGTKETSDRRGLTHRVTDGIRQALKSKGMRLRGVGGGHSSDDDADNITASERRPPTSVMGFDVGGIT